LILRRALPLTVLVLAVPAASAQAGTLAVDKSCYRPGAQGVVSGAGYTPGAPVTFTRNGLAFGGTSADAAGNLIPSTFQSGNVPGGQQRQTLVATDTANPANIGTTSFTATNLDVVVTPTQGNPARKKRIKARGFNKGRILWAHIRGPRKRNVKVGKLKGACGKLDRRRRIFRPGDPVGEYTVQFDQRKKYRAATQPRVSFKVRIFTVVKPSSALGASLRAPTETWTRR
jgi:hypothetical protein